jgi:GNAT superfamily N-acetyltransferase
MAMNLMRNMNMNSLPNWFGWRRRLARDDFPDMTVAVRIARPDESDRVLCAYSEWGYTAAVGPDCTGWLAEAGDELVGVVRIAPENGTLVLRGMRIAEAWRRRGIGSQMLRSLAEWLGDRHCYCLPYSHLVAFYGQIGFAEIVPDAAPAFLAERLEDYTHRRGLSVTIMERSAD